MPVLKSLIITELNCNNCLVLVMLLEINGTPRQGPALKSGLSAIEAHTKS